MEKVAYIEDFTTPVLFSYPPSQLALKLGLPLVIYSLLILPFKLVAEMQVLQFLIVAGVHLVIIFLFLTTIDRRFPMKIHFEAGNIRFERLFGTHTVIPYEEVAAILQTPQLTVFSMKTGLKLIFLPRQTTRQKDFEKVMQIIQNTLQTSRS